MKLRMIGLIAIAFMLSCGSSTFPSPSASPSILQTPTSAPVDMTPDACTFAPPVYHPSRLTQLAPCVTFQGVVIANLREQDGDHHLWIAPDQGFDRLLGSGNVFHGNKALVAEIVPACQAQPVDSSTAAQCPASTIHEPNVRDHVQVIGPWVLDTVHGWNEIHPVVKLVQLPASSMHVSPPPLSPQDFGGE